MLEQVGNPPYKKIAPLLGCAQRKIIYKIFCKPFFYKVFVKDARRRQGYSALTPAHYCFPTRYIHRGGLTFY